MTFYTRPYLYPEQEAAIFCPERFAAIEASTKSGKTVGSIAWLVEEGFKASRGDNLWWVAPVFPQADIAYRRIKLFLTSGSFQAYASPQPRIELLSGATVWIKSADNPDSLYGEDVTAAVGDEASRWKSAAWDALRSTLTATRGRCRLIGNVKGRLNFFYSLARRAEKGLLPDWHYAKITWRQAVAAGVLDVEEVNSARRELSERVFRELYEAEANDDTGNPFGYSHIEACVKPNISAKPPVAWGLDLAKKEDYLVLIGLDEDGTVCAFHRWSGTSWRDSIRRIHTLVGEDTPCLVDSTGVGDPVLEELQEDHGNFAGFMFSTVGKQKLMEGLAVSIQGHEIGYPDNEIRFELEVFEYSVTPSGRVIYAAAEGHNDDCVCALALAREQWATKAPGASMLKYLQQTLTRDDTEPTPAPINNPFPWQQPPLLTKSEQVDNELTELYRETLREYDREMNAHCFRCGALTGTTRVSDGVHVWHPGCI